MRIRDLNRSFGDTHVLKDVSFQVEEGEFFGILGPNGSGKSTLLGILTTVLRPTAGEFEIFGLNPETQRKRVRTEIGAVFQSPALDGKLTARENLRYHGNLYGLRGAELAAASADLLDRFGVTDRSNDRVEILSGGTRRRIELAKALLHRPRLLLLDEPTSGLDPRARADFAAMLRDLQGENRMTILLATHLLDEAEHCDRLAVLDRGRLICLGTPARLRAGIGGEVVSISVREPEAVCARIAREMQLPVRVVGSLVRLEHPEGRRVVPEILDLLGAECTSISVHQPTLEDVFIAHTGREFSDSGVPEEEMDGLMRRIGR